MQLTLSSVAGRVKKVHCIGRAPQAERGLISMRKSNGRARATAEGGEKLRGHQWEGERRVAPHRNTTCHVAKLGIRSRLGNDVVTSAACRAIGAGLSKSARE